MTDCGFALNADIGLEVLDIKGGLGGVLDTPDDDDGDLDGVALLIVDFKFAAFEVASAQGEFRFWP